ncbi:unnamed protein product, partial [marine sediment metagenome]
DCGPGTLQLGFTYDAIIVQSISPSTGLKTGGTFVTIVGRGFRPDCTVRIGDENDESVTVDCLWWQYVSYSTMYAITPPYPKGGDFDVIVRDSYGVEGILDKGFHYRSEPVLTSVTPTTGPMKGGFMVTVWGDDFLPGATMYIGSGCKWVSLVCGAFFCVVKGMLEPTPPGVYDVIVSNLDGGTGTLVDGFTVYTGYCYESVGSGNWDV